MSWDKPPSAGFIFVQCSLAATPWRTPITISDCPSDPIQPRSAITRTLVGRCCVNQGTDLVGVDRAFRGGIVPVYAGFDATADSLRVGHFLSVMALRRLQQADRAGAVRRAYCPLHYTFISASALCSGASEIWIAPLNGMSMSSTT